MANMTLLISVMGILAPFFAANEEQEIAQYGPNKGQSVTKKPQRGYYTPLDLLNYFALVASKDGDINFNGVPKKFQNVILTMRLMPGFLTQSRPYFSAFSEQVIIPEFRDEIIDFFMEAIRALTGGRNIWSRKELQKYLEEARTKSEADAARAESHAEEHVRAMNMARTMNEKERREFKVALDKRNEDLKEISKLLR